MNTSAIISLIFTIGFWILFLYVVIRAHKKRKARQAEATAQTGISKTFFGRVISSLGRFFSLLFLAVVGIMMILGTVGLIVSDNKTNEVAETGQETATTETNAEAKTYYVKSGAANIRECPSTPCKVINTLPQNTELIFPGDLFDKYPDWAEITFQDGRVGYISKTTLSSEPSSVSVAPAKPSPQENGIFLGEGNFDPLIIGYSYGISFCVPESARSGATCGGLAGDTQTPVGGSPPYSLVKGSGFLPPGMSLELNGLLSGAPTTEGTYNFQICAKDLKMNQGCQSYKMVVVKEEETLPISPNQPPAQQTNARRYTVSFYAEGYTKESKEAASLPGTYHQVFKGGPATVDVFSNGTTAKFEIPFTINVSINVEPKNPYIGCMVSFPGYSGNETFTGVVPTELRLDPHTQTLELYIHNPDEYISDRDSVNSYTNRDCRIMGTDSALWRGRAMRNLLDWGSGFDSDKVSRIVELSGGLIGGWWGPATSGDEMSGKASYTIAPAE